MSGEGLQAGAVAHPPEFDGLILLPEASVCPSGAKATEATPIVCPVRVCRQAPSLTRQSLMVSSTLPEASVCPSGAKATESHVTCMPGEGLQAGAVAHPPEFDGVIPTAGGQRLPIRREGHGFTQAVLRRTIACCPG